MREIRVGNISYRLWQKSPQNISTLWWNSKERFISILGISISTIQVMADEVSLSKRREQHQNRSDYFAKLYTLSRVFNNGEIRRIIVSLRCFIRPKEEENNGGKFCPDLIWSWKTRNISSNLNNDMQGVNMTVTWQISTVTNIKVVTKSQHRMSGGLKKCVFI